MSGESTSIRSLSPLFAASLAVLYHRVGILWRPAFRCNVTSRPLVDQRTNAKLGYLVVKTGTTERILPRAVAQRFEVSSSGALIPATEGSRPSSSMICG